MKKELKIYILFSIVYGLVFINYIDISNTISSNPINGYHLWLIFMYFIPFSILAVYKIKKNWSLVIFLGLLTSLMNDVFYGLTMYLFSPISNIDLGRYYYLWLIPQSEQLFSLNLGFVIIPIYSWIMAISIYIRIIIIVILLKLLLRKEERNKESEKKKWDS